MLSMGKVPEPETKRNHDLARDYLLKDEDGNWKYTLTQLGLKYARENEDGILIPLTSGRIHQILTKLKIEKNRVVKKSSKK